MSDAAFATNLDAGLVVEKLGTASVTYEELTAVAMRHRHESGGDKKIGLPDNVMRKRRRWAATSERVVH